MQNLNTFVKSVIADEQGAETVEVVGAMAAIAALLAVVVNLMSGAGGTEISELVVSKVTSFLNRF
ncbi:MAG: hypothetical protein H7Z42_01040 [Roseiflexaceae bacterium]|nr:hypothetical protein [Roseiflexaceae bacterium]